MWLNPLETADLATFTEEILNGNFIFCVVARQNHELLNDIKYFVRLYLVM